MERLLCCLLGFPEKDAQVLRSLTRLFRPSLSVDWAFEVGVSENCDLLVCDLDDAGGRHAWNSPAPPGLLRAAASTTDVDAGALLLRKPLRGHGPSGIVGVLNAAAALRRPGVAPPAPPLGTSTAAPSAAEAPPAPVAFFKPEPARPLAETHTEPDAIELVERDPATPGTVDEAETADEAGAPVSPAPKMTAAVAPANGAKDPVAHPLRTPAATQQVEAVQDEADIKDILRRMRFATLGATTEARTMLDALRDLRGSEQAAVVEAPGLKSLCVMPQARAWFSTLQPPEIFSWLGAGKRPVRVLSFASTDEARDAAGCRDEPARPLDQLLWLACIRTPPENIETYESALFRLKRWPDLGNLPHEPHHMHWCGILTRQQAPLHALANSGGVPAADTAAFLDACAELGILERAHASPEEVAAVQLPVVSKKGRERASLFKNILGRLRIFRS